VLDGDTVIFLDANNSQRRVRLTGIDAPEKEQSYGMKSKQHLSDLVLSKSVVVYWSKEDDKGRLLGKILVDGHDANLAQVRAGFAWHYKQYERNQSLTDRITYAAAAFDARRNRLGLWQEHNPIMPSEFRHSQAGASTASIGAPRAAGACLCGSAQFCTGPREGVYCVNAQGQKKY
jgi:endonuclease YncB( thermonuclease family)